MWSWSLLSLLSLSLSLSVLLLAFSPLLSASGWVQAPVPQVILCSRISCRTGLTAAECRQTCVVGVSGCNAVNFRGATGECCALACDDPYAPAYGTGTDPDWEAWSRPGLPLRCGTGCDVVPHALALVRPCLGTTATSDS